MAERLKDKIAIVTGAATSGPGMGNGKAAALLFAREGATVVAVDLNEQAAAQTAKEIEAENGRAIAIAGDVSNSGDVRRIVDTMIRCNVILLGMMDTPHIRTLHSDRSQEEVEQLMRMRDSYCPMGHMGTAWDAAHAALFLVTRLGTSPGPSWSSTAG